MTGRFGLVALPLPLARPYTYRIPEAIADRIEPGARVVVPIRNRELVGVVVGFTDDPPAQEPRDILSAPDPVPALTPQLLEAADWVARYYGAPPGLALRAALPSALWGASRVIATVIDDGRVPGGASAEILAWLGRKGGEAPVAAIARGLKREVWDGINRLERVGAIALRIEPADTAGEQKHERVLQLVGQGSTLLEREAQFRRAPAQRAVLEALENLGGRAPIAHLTGQLGLSSAGIRGLVQRGSAEIVEIAAPRDPFADLPGTLTPTEPTAAQREALAEIERLEAGGGALLFGVTGSGKTLVYLEAIRKALAVGRGAIILVPEIGLTPQMVSRVRGLFGDEVAVLHSGLSEGERADAWRALRSGQRHVAVGARSAVFAPVQNLGVIVVDEEHDASYKNGETPRYHAREVAAVRARLESARLILGSATPSPETFARLGPRLPLLRLPERVGARPLPPVELLDLREATTVREAGPVPWSERLDSVVAAALEMKEQVLILLNRRGYASYLQCPSCGTVKQCDRCSISLTVHQAPARLRCHYCGREEAVPSSCDECGKAVQRMRGVGTQQVEHFLVQRFPGTRIVRMDLDTTSTKWSHHRILEGFGRGESDLLVGTQMIAKGLDFPNVTLVGVVDADTGLYLPDFRAAERTFQLLAQVAGRAGRGPKGGRVIVQTRNPEHYALRFAAQHDSEGFLRHEIASRQDPPYPPHISLLNVVASGPNESEVADVTAKINAWCAALVARHDLPVAVLGPAPCALARIKDRWRWHVLLKGPPDALGRIVRFAPGRLPSLEGVRVSLDRDPGSLL